MIKIMRNRVKKIHMVGIGGSGMSGIAEVLLNLGYQVSGSDAIDTPAVRRLRELGAQITIGHYRKNVAIAQVVIRSTAILDDNPELKEAHEEGIPIIPRAEMLAELMRLRTGIAVAGTHGKTTTTSLLAAIFDEARLDPTVIIGGRLNAYGANARLGQGECLIAEADESDGSFLCLLPIIAVITNVDADHLDFYPSIKEIEDAFVTFMNKVPFYGMNVVCGDDPGVRRLLGRIKRPVITYGLDLRNILHAELLESTTKSRFIIYLNDDCLGEAELNQPGRHNVLNALGALGVALQAGINKDIAFAGLAHFSGVSRRFEYKGKKNNVLVVDDYGHHPVEIAATLATARSCYPNRRLVVIFQPHRFSRTQALFGDFCKVFYQVDKLLLTEIYSASEIPIPGINSLSLAQGITQISDTDVEFFPNFAAVKAALPRVLKSGDLLLTLGAGNVWQIGVNWLEGK
ncbi:UDP-N-acetylmuramate--L-alanine ligase [Desulfovibrionales bacterium]